LRPCFAKKILEHQEEYGLTDNETAYLAGSMFGAGSDTVSSPGLFFLQDVKRFQSAAAISIVIMAAAAFPETQLKVQEQLDSIVGSGKRRCYNLKAFRDLHSFQFPRSKMSPTWCK
jgi:hypothetical protein